MKSVFPRLGAMMLCVIVLLANLYMTCAYMLEKEHFLNLLLCAIVSAVVLSFAWPAAFIRPFEQHYRVEKLSFDHVLLIDITNPGVYLQGAYEHFKHGEVVSSNDIEVKSFVYKNGITENSYIARIACKKELLAQELKDTSPLLSIS